MHPIKCGRPIKPSFLFFLNARLHRGMNEEEEEEEEVKLPTVHVFHQLPDLVQMLHAEVEADQLAVRDDHKVLAGAPEAGTVAPEN